MSRRIIRLSKLSSRNNDVFIQKCVRFFSTGPYFDTRLQHWRCPLV
ncbi:unnamed protein product [Brassica oleracea]|uniref:Uncharacterized protein n=1 Tax=Brassica oleracea TaxID=3712 RepID=A0A3P6GBT5_BRAOL|nr:unnamed protein product [Brassica oleracea]